MQAAVRAAVARVFADRATTPVASKQTCVPVAGTRPGTQASPRGADVSRLVTRPVATGV